MKNSLFVFYLKNYVILHYLSLCLIAIPFCLLFGYLINVNFLVLLLVDFVVIYPLNKYILDISGLDSDLSKFKKEHNIK